MQNTNNWKELNDLESVETLKGIKKSFFALLGLLFIVIITSAISLSNLILDLPPSTDFIWKFKFILNISALAVAVTLIIITLNQLKYIKREEVESN